MLGRCQKLFQGIFFVPVWASVWGLEVVVRWLRSGRSILLWRRRSRG